MNVNLPLPLLGGLSPQVFMRDYWQKKPLLIRAALPDFSPLLSESELFSLAGWENVESRIVKKARNYSLQHGAFDKLPARSAKNWTLLVQGVEQHCQAVYELLQRFRFVPDARLDDVMISWASEGGGVGPHFDSYDVFLLQAAGRRRWQISKQKDLSLVDGAPLKILRHFKPTQSFTLEPGDMLYLPPRYAHDGVALDVGCQTYSIGFRAPRAGELARELLLRLADEIADEMEGDAASAWNALYADPMQEATATPAQLPAELHDFAAQALLRSVSDQKLLAQLIAEVLTEPKNWQHFQATPAPRKKQKTTHYELHPATRMSYDAQHVTINAESFRARGKDAKWLRKLADERKVDATDLGAVPAGSTAIFNEFISKKWLLKR